MLKPTLAALTASATITGAAFAQSGNISLIGYVSLKCEAVLGPASGAVGDLGLLNERCNSPGGYDVWMDYSSDLVGGVILVDGRAVDLGPSLSALMNSEGQPAQRSRRLALSRAPEGARIVIRLVPR